MKVVYVAGPYSADNSWKRELNIRRAEDLALKINMRGHAAICVHTASRYFFGAVSEGHALAADLAILARCDAVFLVRGWMMSRGTVGEIAEAMRLGIPVFEDEVGMLIWMAGDDVESMRRSNPEFLNAAERFGITPLP